MRMKCCPLRKERNGVMQRRQPPMCRPQRISWCRHESDPGSICGKQLSIYQLKGGNETLDYRFEPLDSIHRNGLSVKPENYELVYEAPLTAKDDLESIYTRFNVNCPADFTRLLSVSDIVVLNQDGKNTAHYCDRVGFTEVAEFLQERQPELTRMIWKPVSASERPGQLLCDGYEPGADGGGRLRCPPYFR